MAKDVRETRDGRVRNNPPRSGTSDEIRYRGLQNSGRRILEAKYVAPSSPASDMVKCGSLREVEMDRNVSASRDIV